MFKRVLITTMLVIGSNNIHADIDNRVEGSINNVSQKIQPKLTRGDIILYARSGKKSYVVGDNIGIEIKLRKDAFIYIWSVGKDKKQTLMLPNEFEAYNAYKKEIAYTVPEVSADYSFVSYRKGIEEVYLLASQDKLDKEHVKKIMVKSISTLKNKEVHKTNKSGLTVVAKKPSYDITKFKVITYGSQNAIEINKVVKIESNPYGLEDEYYPVTPK